MEIKISEILKKYDTDKNTGHHYGEAYDDIFSRFDRQSPLNILEVGTQKGGSLRAWKEFFPKATITGVDIIDVVTEENRTDEVSYIVSDIKLYDTSETFDIIIDDGSHFLEDVEVTVNLALKALRRGGVLVIEDVQDPPFWRKRVSDIVSNKYEVRPYDMRHVNNQYDDYLLVVTRI